MPLISADTGEGAAGCASGNHACRGTRPVQRIAAGRIEEDGLGTEAEQREQKGAGGGARTQVHRTHRRETPVSALGMQQTEAQQDRKRAAMRHQQVQKTRAADLREAVLGRHQEVGGQRHRLPGHHEGIGIGRQQHDSHAGEKDMELQAQQTRRGPVALTEVTAGEDRDAGRGHAEQHQKGTGERIEPETTGRTGQTEGKLELLRRRGDPDGGGGGERKTTQCAHQEERPTCEGGARRSHEARDANRPPGEERDEAGIQRRQRSIQCGTALASGVGTRSRGMRQHPDGSGV